MKLPVTELTEKYFSLLQAC